MTISFDPDHLYSYVGQRILTLRRARKLTQDELAAQLGLTRTSITNIEKGRQRFMLHTLVQLALALEVTFEELLPPIVRPETTSNAVAEVADALFQDYPDLQDYDQQYIVRVVQTRQSEKGEK